MVITIIIKKMSPSDIYKDGKDISILNEPPGDGDSDPSPPFISTILKHRHNKVLAAQGSTDYISPSPGPNRILNQVPGNNDPNSGYITDTETESNPAGQNDPNSITIYSPVLENNNDVDTESNPAGQSDYSPAITTPTPRTLDFGRNYKDGKDISVLDDPDNVDTESNPAGQSDYLSPVAVKTLDGGFGKNYKDGKDISVLAHPPGKGYEHSKYVSRYNNNNNNNNNDDDAVTESTPPGQTDPNSITMYSPVLENNDENTLEAEVLDLEKSLGTIHPFSDTTTTTTIPIQGSNTVLIILGCVGLSLGLSISIGLIIIFIAGIISYRKLKLRIEKEKGDLNILYSNHDYKKLENNEAN